MTRPLRLGTRASPLALWQANHVADLLRSVVAVELVQVETTGDQVLDRPLSQIGGDGLFTKEIQRAVLENRADVAVHSLKDLPTFAVDCLVLAAVPARGPTGDALVSLRHRSFDALPPRATVASSSLRRRAQMLLRRPDLHLVDIRGNVDTRLRKLAEHDLDAIILAQAGLERLGLLAHCTEILDLSWMLPAVGQGALGLECRADDGVTRSLLAKLDHAPTSAAVRAERSMLRALGGGCQVPIGAATHMEGATLTLRGVVLPPDGARRILADISGPSADAEALGQKLAHALLAQGAKELLESRSGFSA
jgi:hydroxymethylbilane synthase